MRIGLTNFLLAGAEFPFIFVVFLNGIYLGFSIRNLNEPVLGV